MQAMLIEDDPGCRTRAAQALARAGFEVTVAGSVDAAKAAARRGVVDVLVMAERVNGRLAHDVALLAELLNPGLGTILLSDRTAAEADEMFELLPSLHAVLGRATPAATLARLAVAAARLQGHEPQAKGDDGATPRDEATDLAPSGPGPVPDAVSFGLPVLSQPTALETAPTAMPPATGREPKVAARETDAAPVLETPMADAWPASGPLRAMPPPLAAPVAVPRFLRVGGLASAMQMETPAPLVADMAAAPSPAGRARRLHLA